MGVGAFALGALVPYVPALTEAGTVAMVDLGAKASEVLVLERGEPVFARTLSIGTEGLPATAERLARDLRVSFAAHRAQGGEPPDARVSSAAAERSCPGPRGSSRAPSRCPVQILPEPDDRRQRPSAPRPMRELPRYAKALALALSLAGRGAGMNLRRGPLAFERGFAWVRERIPVLAGLAAVILVSFVFSGWSRLHAAHVERDALRPRSGRSPRRCSAPRRPRPRTRRTSSPRRPP